MEIEKMLFDYKGPIVFVGLGVGALAIFDMLPSELGPVGTYTKFIYLGAVVLAGFVFWKYSINNYGPKPTSYQKTVQPRTFSGSQNPQQQHDQKIFDNFKRD